MKEEEGKEGEREDGGEKRDEGEFWSMDAL